MQQSSQRNDAVSDSAFSRETQCIGRDYRDLGELSLSILFFFDSQKKNRPALRLLDFQHRLGGKIAQ